MGMSTIPYGRLRAPPRSEDGRRRGLQCAPQVIDPSTGRRRIEHLEACAPEDAQRLVPQGIVTSVRLVHAGSAILAERSAATGEAAYTCFTDICRGR